MADRVSAQSLLHCLGCEAVSLPWLSFPPSLPPPFLSVSHTLYSLPLSRAVSPSSSCTDFPCVTREERAPVVSEVSTIVSSSSLSLPPVWASLKPDLDHSCECSILVRRCSLSTGTMYMYSEGLSLCLRCHCSLTPMSRLRSQHESNGSNEHSKHSKHRSPSPRRQRSSARRAPSRSTHTAWDAGTGGVGLWVHRRSRTHAGSEQREGIGFPLLVEEHLGA